MDQAEAAAPIVTRTTTGAARSASRGGAEPIKPAAMAVWTALLVAGLVSLAPMLRSTSQEMTVYSLLQADDDDVRDALATLPAIDATADYFEAISERAMDLGPAAEQAALAAARRAVAKDPGRAFAWARIAYIESKGGKEPTPAAIAAIQASMKACPLCSPDLIRWRFNFVLAHWVSIEETMRRAAFEQADMLRWSGQNAEFLAEMRAKATARGIPYDAYRAAVNTPARTFDIATERGPAPN